MKMKNMMMYLSLFVLPLQAAFFQDCNQVTSALDASVIKLVAVIIQLLQSLNQILNRQILLLT